MKTQECFKSNRSDNRYVTSAGFLSYLMKRTKAKLAFDPEMNVEEFHKWQEKVRDKLKELMAFPEVNNDQPAPKKIFEEKRDGYILEKWEIYPEDGCAVPFLVLIPDTVSSSNPGAAVLCVPGSNGTKELLAGEPEISPNIPPNKHPEHNKMAWWFVKRGFVAIAVDNPVTGETAENLSKPYGGNERVGFSFYALQMGRNYLGISVFQKMKIIEWANQQGYIDSNRIAVSGHSLGTEPIMVLANLMPEISAIIYNDYLCDDRKRAVATCLTSIAIWHIVPGFQEWFSFPDLLSACAPRYLLICEGGPMCHIRKVKSAYKLMNAEENFQFSFLKPYDDPSKRRDDVEEIPEGLTEEEYLTVYANVNTEEHYFKERLAVPWLCKVFSIDNNKKRSD